MQWSRKGQVSREPEFIRYINDTPFARAHCARHLQIHICPLRLCPQTSNMTSKIIPLAVRQAGRATTRLPRTQLLQSRPFSQAPSRSSEALSVVCICPPPHSACFLISFTAPRHRRQQPLHTFQVHRAEQSSHRRDSQTLSPTIQKSSRHAPARSRPATARFYLDIRDERGRTPPGNAPNASV